MLRLSPRKQFGTVKRLEDDSRRSRFQYLHVVPSGWFGCRLAEQRDYGTRREKDVVQMSPEFVDHFAKLKCDFMQLWKQTLLIFGRKGGEQAIFEKLVLPGIQAALVLLLDSTDERQTTTYKGNNESVEVNRHRKRAQLTYHCQRCSLIALACPSSGRTARGWCVAQRLLIHFW